MQGGGHEGSLLPSSLAAAEAALDVDGVGPRVLPGGWLTRAQTAGAATGSSVGPGPPDSFLSARVLFPSSELDSWDVPGGPEARPVLGQTRSYFPGCPVGSPVGSQSCFRRTLFLLSHGVAGRFPRGMTASGVYGMQDFENLHARPRPLFLRSKAGPCIRPPERSCLYFCKEFCGRKTGIPFLSSQSRFFPAAAHPAWSPTGGSTARS